MNLIENWRVAIENIFQMHGPSIALQAIEQEKESIPTQIKELTKASIFYRGKYMEQAQEILAALEVPAKDLEAVYWREWQLMKAGIHSYYGQYQAALSVLEPMVTTAAATLDVSNQYAYLQDKLGIKSYAESYPKLLQLFDNHYEVKAEYAWYLFQQQQKELAKSIALEVIAVDPNHVKALDILGYVALENAEDQLAYDYFIKSSEIWPFNKTRLQALAQIALLNHDLEGEEKAYRYALQYYKEDGFFNLKLLTLLLRRAHPNTKELVELGNKAVQQLPQDVKAHFFCAYAYYLDGQLEQAAAHLSPCYTFAEIPVEVHQLQANINALL